MMFLRSFSSFWFLMTIHLMACSPFPSQLYQIDQFCRSMNDYIELVMLLLSEGYHIQDSSSSTMVVNVIVWATWLSFNFSYNSEQWVDWSIAIFAFARLGKLQICSNPCRRCEFVWSNKYVISICVFTNKSYRQTVWTIYKFVCICSLADTCLFLYKKASQQLFNRLVLDSW